MWTVLRGTNNADKQNAMKEGGKLDCENHQRHIKEIVMLSLYPDWKTLR
jgi:hypothetical protein